MARSDGFECPLFGHSSGKSGHGRPLAQRRPLMGACERDACDAQEGDHKGRPYANRPEVTSGPSEAPSSLRRPRKRSL